jgi:ParB family transcriptional regulator, chromosome partitioning protein
MAAEKAARPTRGSSDAEPSPSSPSARQAVTGAVPLNSSGQTSGKTVAPQTIELGVHEIDNNPFQPRRKFNEEEIASLAESIREHEQLQPILVRKVGQRYQLISGERRLRATIHAGLKTIRAEVREADDRLVAELAIVENLQRKDLDAIEKALSFRRYIDEHKCRQDDLAKRLKIDRSTIANLMRLLELPAQIQQWVQEDKLSYGHARTLLPLGEERQQLAFARAIMEDGWSVRETERRVSEQLKREDGEPIEPGPGKKKPSPQIAALEQQLRLALGTKIEIKQSANGRGKITIAFANNDEFERLRDVLCPPAKKSVA